MIKYFKENLSHISKLFINHVGMTIFSLAVLITSWLLAKKNDAPIIFYIMGIIAVLMYFSLIYTAMWERGAKDKIKIDGGRLTYNPWHGLYMYLIANAVAVIAGVLAFALSFFESVPFLYNVYTVFMFIAHWWRAMYLPITTIALSPLWLHTLLYIAIILPGALVSTVSYILGAKGYKCIFPEPKHDKNKKYR